METGIIISLISAGLGAGISLISVYINNKSQLNRDRLKYQNDFKLENLKIENDSNLKYRTELLQNIERLNIILGKIENYISLTTSVIESSHKLSSEEFDKKYIQERFEIIELESIVIAYFPDLFENIRRVNGMHNNYWGHQRLLLMTEIETQKESYVSLQKKIIEISNETYSEIDKTRNKIITVSENIKNKYVP
ncbi:hypothetical protein [Tenacibaculum discolor]|uniref:hypothetical protein n=1 Tax=Tenacibaculum discolor TaxID=361581 RepID=UPI003F79E3B5